MHQLHNSANELVQKLFSSRPAITHKCTNKPSKMQSKLSINKPCSEQDTLGRMTCIIIYSQPVISIKHNFYTYATQENERKKTKQEKEINH
jgi:hypothetical protein